MIEYEYEPIPGLPGVPPEGEEILWQGKPDWRVLANHAFHIREITAYFALFLSARGIVAFIEGDGLVMSLLSALAVAPLAAAGTGIMALIAWAMARSTIYTITTHRVVFRFGVALQMCFNIPFKQIDSASLKLFKSGHGDIPLTTAQAPVLGYVHLWPHVRPWRFSQPVPMMRAVPNAAEVGALLVDAMKDATERKQGELAVARSPSTPPVARPALVALK